MRICSHAILTHLAKSPYLRIHRSSKTTNCTWMLDCWFNNHVVVCVVFVIQSYSKLYLRNAEQNVNNNPTVYLCLTIRWVNFCIPWDKTNTFYENHGLVYNCFKSFGAIDSALYKKEALLMNFNVDVVNKQIQFIKEYIHCSIHNLSHWIHFIP